MFSGIKNMAPQSRKEELLAAWRALSGHADKEGWRTIQIGKNGKCRFLAGRHFPGNEEGLLIGLQSIQIPADELLPQGHGFIVSKVSLSGELANNSWVTLSRQSGGSLELFAMMADDVFATLEALDTDGYVNPYKVFISRIWAWQDFMKKGGDGVLDKESETGLFGELEFLQEVMFAGVPCFKAIEAWQGPLDRLHDFALGNGVLEVKTTTAKNGFVAKIGSLEQLDNSLIEPIYIVGVKLDLNPSGMSLPQKVVALRNMLKDFPAALAVFNQLLIHGGFLDELEARYTRRFSRKSIRIIEVLDKFPRLTRENVDVQICQVRYEVDLDLVQDEGIELALALKKLGVIT
jgi:hypothetical protein